MVTAAPAHNALWREARRCYQRSRPEIRTKEEKLYPTRLTPLGLLHRARNSGQSIAASCRGHALTQCCSAQSFSYYVSLAHKRMKRDLSFLRDPYPIISCDRDHARLLAGSRRTKQNAMLLQPIRRCAPQVDACERHPAAMIVSGLGLSKKAKSRKWL